MQGHRNLHAANVDLLQRLQQFQAVFHAADCNGSGCVDEQGFLSAFKGRIGSDERSLRHMFMDVDSDCDGLIHWEEFSAHLLLDKSQGSSTEEQSPGSSKKATPTFRELHTSSPAAMAAAAGSADNAGTSSGNSTSSPGHQEPITCLVHAATSLGTPDRWCSTTAGGIVQVWNGKDLSHLRSNQSGLSAITAATYLPSSTLLALGSYSSSLSLLDPVSGRQAGALPNIANTAALSLAAWPAPAAAAPAAASTTFLLSATAGGNAGDGSSTSRSIVGVSRDLLAVGDADGSVHLLELDIDDTAEKKTSERFTTRKLWHCNNHHDWVVSVLHCPHISSVAAASLDKCISLTDLERCIAVRTLAGHTKPVHCCAWNGMLKVLASGGADKRVLLWNPFSCRTLGSMVGHSAPVVCLASNERDMQIISAAADHTVKVWDLRNQCCLQTLQLNRAVSTIGGHQHPLSVMAFSPQTRLLAAGAVGLQGWVLSDANDVRIRLGHREAVSWLGCIDALQEVVSTDHAGMVCCWDVNTGRLRNSFANTHGGCRISTAAFDAHCRRLFTGAEDGSIKVWNFRTGTLLSSLSRSSPGDRAPGSQWGSGSGVEVTGLAVVGSTDTNGQAAPCIVSTGWDRQVSWYADTGKPKCPLLRASSGPTSDVLAAAVMPGAATLALACYNGEVRLMNLDSGSVTRRLVAPALQAQPLDERAVEALAFMQGEFKHALVAVGADCVLRFWDCHSGNCLEHDAADHTAAGCGALCAVLVSRDNTTAVTADTNGSLSVWDICSTHSALRNLAAAAAHKARPSSALATGTCISAAILSSSRVASSRPHSGVSGGSPRAYSRASGPSPSSCLVQQAVGVVKLATWRAHADAVTVLAWVPAAAHAAADTSAKLAAVSSCSVAAAAEEAGEALAAAPPLPKQALTGALNMEQLLLQQQQQQQGPHSSRPPTGSRPLLQFLQDEQQTGHAPNQHSFSLLQVPLTSNSCCPNTTGASSCHEFILSAALDRSMVLWSSAGARVGTFGASTWLLDDPSTWQDTTDHSCKVNSSSAGGQAELLLCQHSLGSTCSSSSSDLSGVTTAMHPSDAAAAACRRAAEPVTSGSNNTLQYRLSSPAQGSEQQLDKPSGSTEVPLRPPGVQVKSVAFADEVLQEPWSAAAAAVAAAAADAKLPCCLQPGIDSATSDTFKLASSTSQGADARICIVGNTGEATGLAAEEDLPSTLWFPEFAQFSRPATAAQRLMHTNHCSILPRPSTASAAYGSRLQNALLGGNVLTSVGQGRCILDGRPKGLQNVHKLAAATAASNSTGKGGPVSRPGSAGRLQGRKSGNAF